MSSAPDRKLLSMFCLPGHHMPGTPLHCAAEVINRIGLPVRFASARPSFNTPYQAMPETIFSYSARYRHKMVRLAEQAVHGLAGTSRRQQLPLTMQAGDRSLCSRPKVILHASVHTHVLNRNQDRDCRVGLRRRGPCEPSIKTVAKDRGQCSIARCGGRSPVTLTRETVQA